MFSAGTDPTTMYGPTAPQAGYPQQQGGVFMNGQWYYPSSQGSQQPTVYSGPAAPFTPVAVPTGSTPVANVNVNAPTMTATEFQTFMTAQNTAAAEAQKGAQNTNLIGASINATTDICRQGFQYGAVQLHYQYLETAAAYQRDILKAEIDLKSEALASSERMQDKQIDHEENLARINAGLQRQLAVINANTKEKIAEMISLNETFSRRTRDYGSPLYSC